MKKGFSLLLVVGLLFVLGIVATVIPSVVGSSNKQIELQRAESAALILEMNIRSILNNPRSYSSISPTFELESQLATTIMSLTRTVPGTICDAGSVFCNVGVSNLTPTATGYRVEIKLLGSSNKKMLRTFEQEGPQLSGSNIIHCSNPNLPIFTGISSAGVAQCRALNITTCPNNQFVTGIGANLNPICQTLPNRRFIATTDKFIASTKFIPTSASLDIVSTDKRSETELLEGGEPVIKLEPVEFEPRSGRVNNIDYINGPLYHSDASSVKCPDEFPEIKIVSQEVQETIPGQAKCTTQYTHDKKAATIKCTSPNASNRVKLKVNHECGKGPGP